MFFLAVPVYANDNSNFDTILDTCKVRYASVDDYTCKLHKREFIGGAIREERNIIFKFRKPDRFYMKWTEGKNEGTEALYVEGKYDNKLVVHLGVFFGLITISTDPRSKVALRNNRHSIKEAGLGHIIQVMEKNYRKATTEGDLTITAQYDAMLHNRSMILLKTVFPKNKRYYGHRIDVHIDQELLLPVKLTVYGWNNEFLEEYHFDDLELNSGLAEEDFDIKNPEYGFGIIWKEIK